MHTALSSADKSAAQNSVASAFAVKQSDAFQWGRNNPELPLSRGNTTNCHHGSLDPPTSTAQTASRSVHPVCRAHTLAAKHTRLSASSAASISIFLSSSESAAASRNLSASSSVTALASSALHSDLLMSDSFAVINDRHVKQLQR